MNKRLSKFYVSVRRKDGSLFQLSARAALDHRLKSPTPHNEKKNSLRQPCTCLVKRKKGLKGEVSWGF